GTNEIDFSCCFVGNSVSGGRDAVWCYTPGDSISSVCTLNVSGNDFALYPPIGDYPGAGVGTQYCTGINIFGNTLETGGHGFVFGPSCGGALIGNNNFANVTYRGIGAENGGGTIQNVSVFNNILGEGATFHVQLPFTN